MLPRGANATPAPRRACDVATPGAPNSDPLFAPKRAVAESRVSCDARPTMAEERPTERPGLTRATTLAYALGGVAFGVKESGLQLFLLLGTVSVLLLARYPIDREAHERALQLLEQLSIPRP